MKKNTLISLLFLAPLLFGCATSGYTFENSSFDPGGIDNYLRDSDMILDGKAEESHYSNLEFFEFYEPENKVTMKTKVYPGQNGWYFYCEVNDTTVLYSDSKQLYQNDGIELHVCIDPAQTLEIENIHRKNKVLNTMIQIRISVGDTIQTWVSNGLERDTYEWTMYYRPCETKVFVDGELNVDNGAKGYSVETYLPYSAFNLNSAPENISIMPAFNNTASNLDTSRKWFTKKGMAHNYPSSWVWYNKTNGFIYDGKGISASKNLSLDENDSAYANQVQKEVYEVDSNNSNPELRGYFKSYFDRNGVYVFSKVYDKIYSRNNDSIWDNDGIEIMIDTKPGYSDNCYKDGMYRFAVDVDQGLQSDMYMTGCNDAVPYYVQTENKVKINKIDPRGHYGYEYEYFYEVYIPFESMKTSYDLISTLNVCFAIKSPLEKAFVQDRRDGSGNMESQDWLWIDHHYPLNALEFFEVTEGGLL